MKIAELKQVDTKTVQIDVIVPAEYQLNENGETIITVPEHMEKVLKETPIMDVVYRESTSDEEAEMLAYRREAEEREANREPTAEERIEAQVMYTALMTDTLLMEE